MRIYETSECKSDCNKCPIDMSSQCKFYKKHKLMDCSEEEKDTKQREATDDV